MFDVCTTGDTAHIDTIFKLLPHTRKRVWQRLVCVRAHTHQTLCCHITTTDFYNFKKTFKSSDFNKEPTSSLKMIRIMIETCWSVFKCFNTNILD